MVDGEPNDEVPSADWLLQTSLSIHKLFTRAQKRHDVCEIYDETSSFIHEKYKRLSTKPPLAQTLTAAVAAAREAAALRAAETNTTAPRLSPEPLPPAPLHESRLPRAHAQTSCLCDRRQSPWLELEALRTSGGPRSPAAALRAPWDKNSPEMDRDPMDESKIFPLVSCG